MDVGYRLGAASGDTALTITVGGTTTELGLLDLGPDGVRVLHDGVSVPCAVRVHPDGSVWVNDPARAERLAARAAAARPGAVRRGGRSRRGGAGHGRRGARRPR